MIASIESQKTRKYFAIIRNIALALTLLSLLTSCGGTKSSVEDFATLSRVVQEGDFDVENQWATPMRGGRVNLIGNTNYIRFRGDSVNVFLPYFGVRHSGGGFGSEGAIRYEGIAENLEIEEHQDDNRIKIWFEGRHEGEDFDFSMTLFPNGKVSTSVNSSQRDAISYEGDLDKVTEEEE